MREPERCRWKFVTPSRHADGGATGERLGTPLGPVTGLDVPQGGPCPSHPGESRTGGRVAQVQIKCPQSGLWGWTDVEEDPARWEPAALVGHELVCGICGERHVATRQGLRIPDWSHDPHGQGQEGTDVLTAYDSPRVRS